MQSRLHNFPFDVNFNFATENLTSYQTLVPGEVNPPITECFILTETGDFVLGETGTFLIPEICNLDFVLVEDGTNMQIESGDFILLET